MGSLKKRDIMKYLFIFSLLFIPLLANDDSTDGVAADVVTEIAFVRTHRRTKSIQELPASVTIQPSIEPGVEPESVSAYKKEDKSDCEVDIDVQAGFSCSCSIGAHIKRPFKALARAIKAFIK